MSNPKLGLPADHPFSHAAGKTPAELVADVMAYNRSRFGGWSCKLVDGVEVPDDDPRPADPPENDDDDGEVTIEGKVHKIKDLKRIMAEEKRQGARSGQRKVLEELGVADLEAAKALIAAAQEAQRAQETAAQTAAREAQESKAASDRTKAEAADEVRVARLERALVRRGVADEDLDDGVALLQKSVAADADADAIATAADALKERRPELFDATPPAPGRPAAQLPTGRPGSRPTPKGQPFGAAGLARAEKRFGKTNA